MTERRRGAFTLLEVLAAVAIFGIVFTALSAIAIDWIAAEGESERRLRASLVADNVVAGIEAELAAGRAPAIGDEASERGDFEVTVLVSPFELPFEIVSSDTAALAAAGQPAPSLIRPAADPDQSLLRTVEVEVTWIEGAATRSVSRTTYAFDLEAAQPLLSELPGADDAEEDLEDEDDEDDDSDEDEE